MSRSRRAVLGSVLASLSTAAFAPAPAVGAPASAAISGTSGQLRLSFQVPGHYGQQGSLTSGGPLDGRYVADRELASGAICSTAMKVRGLLRSADRRPVRDGSVVRWRLGRRSESLVGVDAAGRLAGGGRWWTSGRSNIDVRDEFPTATADHDFRFGIADVRAPDMLPAGRGVLVKVVVTSSAALPPGPAPAEGSTPVEPSAGQRRECRSHARRWLPADVRRVLRHMDVRAGVDAVPRVG